jgi:DNA-binding FadR family transcriptional regulator
MVSDEPYERLYREIARTLIDRINDGTYPVGARLPAEREISVEFNVSRPTVREAIIALEVQGLVEVRVGSGAYVLPPAQQPEGAEPPGFNVSAFELTEARLLIEGEAAALAATHITDEELTELRALVQLIKRNGNNVAAAEEPDRQFHLLIARATRNKAVYNSVQSLWALRQSSPECALLHNKARAALVKPVVEEHLEIVSALQTRDPARARSAMRSHLAAVIEHLLFATEEEAIEKAKQEARNTRARYARATSL